MSEMQHLEWDWVASCKYNDARNMLENNTISMIMDYPTDAVEPS